MAKWSGDKALEVLTLSLEGEIFAIEASYVREKFSISCRSPKYPEASHSLAG